MKTIDLAELLRQGENASIEFKAQFVRPESLAKEMIAFANTQGGVILVGVSDQGDVVGIKPEESPTEYVSNIARNNVIPPVDVQIERIIDQDKVVIAIIVPKGKDKPYQTLNHQFLIRVGSTNRVASQTELMRLFQQSGVFHYDAIAVENTSIKNINLHKISEYFDAYQIDFEQEDAPENLLKNTDILTENYQASIAGLLVFALNPQKFIPSACISFAHFAGNEMTEELIDKQTITGTLDQQIDTMLAVIKNNIKMPSTIQAAKTEPKVFCYPDKVFRELLVNACVHRNYAISGSRIRVFMFSNRIEFISPGKLPNTVTIEKLSYGVSYA
ncbi:MAG: putative DNA binding domain-containing protein, partial [Methylococcales bacterium]|nr:putative DNA binding domain-containing protein [Methylococcales bacterium]